MRFVGSAANASRHNPSKHHIALRSRMGTTVGMVIHELKGRGVLVYNVPEHSGITWNTRPKSVIRATELFRQTARIARSAGRL